MTLHHGAYPEVPDDLEQLRAACVTLMNEGRDNETLALIDRALAIEPRDHQFVGWRAHVLSLVGRHFDAVATWRNYAALPWKPAFFQMGLGQGLVMCCDTAQGIVLLDRAHRTAVADNEWFAPRATHLFGEALLRAGDPAGFAHWLERNRSDTGNYRVDGIPTWSGEEDLRGKRVLITHQLGFGDQFLLFACVQRWLAAGAQLMITCDTQIHALMQASLPDCVVVSAPRPLTHGEALPGALLEEVRAFGPDLHATLLHLPMLNAQTTAAPYFPAWLRAPEAQRQAAAEWASGLRAAQPGKALIGIFWDCVQRHTNIADAKMRCSAVLRSLPFDGVERLVSHPDVAQKRHFVSLHHPAAQAFAGMPDGNVSVYGPGIDTFADTAACIEQMDAVIAVDSAVANLSAMLGKLTVVPLNAAGEWRWGVAGDASPWMANLKLVRQTVPGDWRSVIDETAALLAA